MSAPKRNSIICNEDSNEYFVNYNEVKVLKNGLNFTLLKVKVFPFFSTSLKVKVLKILLKYSNALLLLRYCTTLPAPEKYLYTLFRRRRSAYIHLFGAGEAGGVFIYTLEKVPLLAPEPIELNELLLSSGSLSFSQ